MATPLRAGNWGGSEIEIHVANDQIDFTTTRCVRGFMTRPVIDARGNFTGDAMMQPMGGPPPPPPLPHAVVTGEVHGDLLTLTARYDNGFTVGPLQATFNAAGPTFLPCPP